ncbi:MAG: MmgE/PrpD family protein [Pseudomonadota bacterium]
MSDLTQSLAAFAAEPVTTTSPVRLITAMSVLDWCAVGRAGAEEPVSVIVRDMILEEGGAPQAHLFGHGAAPVRAAALVNGTISHALDYDDTHFAHIGHPSVAVIPAALAVSEWRSLPLVELQESALIGMELSIRVGLWLGRQHYQTGFHQTATAGAFGAAAAAGRLLGLRAEQMQQAFGLAATRAAGLKAQFGTMGKPYNAGIASAAGVEAAHLIARGFAPRAGAMEGAGGFGQTHYGENNVAAAVEGLGDTWLFEDVSHKFHACCHGLHAVLEAARRLDIAEPEIAEMTVLTHPRWITVCNQPSPTDGLGAKFSFRTVLAMHALGYDTARLDSYSEKVCADDRLIRLRERIKVESDETLTETQAQLNILKRDGQRMEASHDLLTPMSLSLREERVRNKAAKLIGMEDADEIWALLRSGGDAVDLANRLATP